MDSVSREAGRVLMSLSPLASIEGLHLDQMDASLFLGKLARWPHPSPSLSHWAVERTDSRDSVEKS